MTEPLTYIYLISFIAVAVSTILLALAAPPQPAKGTLVIAMSLAAGWALGDFASNTVTTIGHLRITVAMTMFAWAPLPYLMLRLAFIYGEYRRVTRSSLLNAVLVAPTALAAFIVLSGRLHASYLPAPIHGGFYFAEVSGWQHFVNGYFIIYMAASGVVLSRAFARTSFIEYRRPARLFLLLVVPATILGAITNGGLAFAGVHPPFLASVITSGVGVTLGLGMLGQSVFAPLAEYKRHAETLLRSSEKRYRTLAELSPDAVAVFAFDGRLRMVNARFAELFGFADINACLAWQGGAFDLIADNHRMAAYQAAARTAHQTRSGPGELLCRRVDGREFPVEASGAVLHDAYGTPEGLVVVARDLSERKRAEVRRRELETQVQRTQKLESLGLLAGGIAHDFNNILAAILGNAGLALESVDDGDADQLRQRLETIRDAARRASSLTRQMLAYAGRSNLVFDALDVSRLVREMTDLLRVSISKKVELQCELADGIQIPADASQMQQVVLNLITNAAEAIGEARGRITLRTGPVAVRSGQVRDGATGELLAPGEYLELAVVDTGVGMDEETKQRMFDPFFTTKFTGRGLGLAAVLGIVHGHHGALIVDSRKGRGTEIRVLLPRRDGVLANRGLDAMMTEGLPPARWRGHGTVLIVDDEPLVREVARLTLKGRGFEVVCAEDGSRALELFERHAREVVAVLLDVTMPGLDGAETFAQLRAMRPELPVLWSSGHGEQRIASLGGAPRCDFLAKPYQPKELVAKLYELVARPRGAIEAALLN